MLAWSILAIPFTIFTPMSPNVYVLLTGVFFATLCGAAWAVMMPVGFQLYAPSRMRARFMALYLLAANLLGLSVGPIAAVYFAGLWKGAPRPLAHGAATIGMIAAPILLTCCIAVYRAAGGRVSAQAGKAVIAAT